MKKNPDKVKAGILRWKNINVAQRSRVMKELARKRWGDKTVSFVARLKKASSDIGTALKRAGKL